MFNLGIAAFIYIEREEYLLYLSSSYWKLYDCDLLFAEDGKSSSFTPAYGTVYFNTPYVDDVALKEYVRKQM